MAAKKKKPKPKKTSRVRGRGRRRFGRFWQLDDKERRWYSWNHDLDTILHELVKNPGLADVAVEDILLRAEQFADQLHALQDRRRPPGVKYDGRY